MHILQPKHTKLGQKEVEEILEKYNISLAQLPKIPKKDPTLPEGCKTGEVFRIERTGEYAETYYRVVV